MIFSKKTALFLLFIFCTRLLGEEVAIIPVEDVIRIIAKMFLQTALHKQQIVCHPNKKEKQYLKISLEEITKEFQSLSEKGLSEEEALDKLETKAFQESIPFTQSLDNLYLLFAVKLFKDKREQAKNKIS